MKTLSNRNAMAVPLAHHRFTVEQFDEMVAHGILSSDDRVELLAGEIVQMSPIGTRHSACVTLLFELLWKVFHGRVTLRDQNPLLLSDNSKPQPDFVLLKRRRDAYAHADPRPDDVYLLIEVADSSLEEDRAVKLPLYAAAGVREVWIVNLRANVIERYTDPRDGVYTVSTAYDLQQQIPVAAFPGVAVDVREIIPD